MACSGGKCPKLNLEDGLNEGTATMNTVAGLDSNFVFESKFKTLIKKLKKIRDTEPECKSSCSLKGVTKCIDTDSHIPFDFFLP